MSHMDAHTLLVRRNSRTHREPNVHPQGPVTPPIDIYKQLEEEVLLRISPKKHRTSHSHKLLKFARSKEFMVTKIRFEDEYKSNHKYSLTKSLSNERINPFKREIESTPNYFGTVVDSPDVKKRSGSISRVDPKKSRRDPPSKKLSLPTLPQQKIDLMSSKHVPPSILVETEPKTEECREAMYYFRNFDEDHSRFLINMKNVKMRAIELRNKIFK